MYNLATFRIKTAANNRFHLDIQQYPSVILVHERKEEHKARLDIGGL